MACYIRCTFLFLHSILLCPLLPPPIFVSVTSIDDRYEFIFLLFLRYRCINSGACRPRMSQYMTQYICSNFILDGSWVLHVLSCLSPLIWVHQYCWIIVTPPVNVTITLNDLNCGGLLIIVSVLDKRRTCLSFYWKRSTCSGKIFAFRGVYVEVSM